jgi:hypothetical protein
MAEVAWHVSGQKAQDLAAALIDAEEPRGSVKTDALQMGEQSMLQGPVIRDRPPDGRSEAYHARRHAASKERDLGLAHRDAPRKPPGRRP